MRLFLTGLVVAVLVVFAAERSYQAYQWKKIADKRAYYAELAGAYLFAPSGVVLKASGQTLSRQQLMDYLLHNVVERNPELAFVK